LNELISYLKSNQYIRTAEIINDIVLNPYFQRLKDISYLATFKFAFHKDIEFSRYRHSIETALLLAKLVVRNNIKEDIGSKIILNGLLHDIGHIFFSHIGERILKKREDFNHEKNGQLLIKENFGNIFKKHKIEIPLYENIPNEHRVLIKSHFDIDTIQGILHTAELLELYSSQSDGILDHFYFSGKTDSWQLSKKGMDLLIDFWKLKSKIYEDFVYSLKNQFIETLMIKFIPRFPKLSKKCNESDIILFLANNKDFNAEMNNLNHITKKNSFYINLNKSIITSRIKFELSKLLEQFSIPIHNIVKVKILKNPVLNTKKNNDLQVIEKKINFFYDKIYRIYIFSQNESIETLKIKKKIKLLF